MDDRGLFITSQAIRRQLAAMPNELYLIRLIHRPTRRPFPGERLWTATQLLHATTVRFLRARNREWLRRLHPSLRRSAQRRLYSRRFGSLGWDDDREHALPWT